MMQFYTSQTLFYNLLLTSKFEKIYNIFVCGSR